MMKLAMVSMMALFVTACASKGDLEALQDRVSAVETNQKVLASDIEKCNADMAASRRQCVEHCNTLSSKLDKVFKKSQLK